MQDNFTFKKILKRGLVSGTVFTLLWASWAYYANMSHCEAAAQRAAITQASFTVVNAFVYTMFMEYMFSRGNSVLSRFLLAFVVPNLVVTALLTQLHVYRETPNVLATVAPSLSIVYALSLFYVLFVGPRKLKESGH